jgi:hypothetical protein
MFVISFSRSAFHRIGGLFLKKKKKQNLDWCIDPVLMSNCVISVVSVVIFGILWSR